MADDGIAASAWPAWVLDRLEVGLLLLDADGRLLRANRWFAERCAADLAAAAGRLLTESFPELASLPAIDGLAAAGRVRLPRLLANSLHPTPFPLYADAAARRAGQRLQQSVRILPAPTGSGKLTLVEVRDVTPAVARERLLRQQAEQLRASATTDALTGLANRGFLNTMLDEEFRRALRTRGDRSLAAIMIDVDRFKQYNDTYGHLAGDRCLAAVARQIRQTLQRPGDLAGRYGGEELLLLLPDTGLKGALRLARALCVGIAGLGIVHKASDYGVVTVSQGVAALVPQPGDTPEALIAQADRALYGAKAAGRNCVAALCGDSLLIDGAAPDH